MSESDDLISRQAAIDACHNYEDGKDAYAYGYVVEERLQAMPSAQLEPHWIPCSERLPDEYGDYLITKETIGWNMSAYRTIDIAYFDTVWHKADKVLAWMPLPEPWKGADNEQV